MKVFKVLKRLSEEDQKLKSLLITVLIMTDHAESERLERFQAYDSLMEEGQLVDMFIVDTEHPNGLELHIILDSGLSIIHNDRTEKLITMIAMRPHQYTRYYEQLGLEYDENIRQRCYKNYKRGLNNL